MLQKTAGQLLNKLRKYNSAHFDLKPRLSFKSGSDVDHDHVGVREVAETLQALVLAAKLPRSGPRWSFNNFDRVIGQGAVGRVGRVGRVG